MTKELFTISKEALEELYDLFDHIVPKDSDQEAKLGLPEKVLNKIILVEEQLRKLLRK